MNFVKLLASTCLLAAACGGTGGDDGGTMSQPDLNGAHLQSGTYSFSQITKIEDGCGLTLEDPTNPPSPIALANTGTMLTLGTHYDATTTPAWSPPGYGFGTGPYTSGTTATLTTSATATLTDGCSWMLSRMTNLTFVGNNDLMVDFTDNESSFSMCTNTTTDPTPPTGGSCTSHYTFHLKM